LKDIARRMVWQPLHWKRWKTLTGNETEWR
jgi:hypothetical protein